MDSNSGDVNISDIGNSGIEVGAIVTGNAEGDIVGRDKIVHQTHYHYVERPAQNIPYLAPNLPPHHVPRNEELTALRDLLLGQDRDVAVTALRGMGGIGKTTLAIALCHDKQVLDAFPDGVLWATLGPQADLLSAQTAWGAALGDDLTKLPDADARASRLRSLLRDQHCLLVIDDVWEAIHLPPMQVGGPQCATLVTTRERKIAQKVGIARDLNVLEPQQAIALLAQWAGEINDDEKPIAGELAKRLGYLPLALALAGAQTQEGETWEDLLAVFRDAQGADVTLLDLDDPSMRDESLALTFELSLKRLGDALPQQFAMLGVFAAGREAAFTAEAAAAVWEMGQTKARKLLDRLVRAALLNKEGGDYALHLLLGDYARSQLDEATRQGAIARHKAYYLKVAQHSEKEWQAADSALPQMKIAWSRVESNDAETLFAWSRATELFFQHRGYWATNTTWTQATLAAVQTTDQREREGWCQHNLGVIYLSKNKLDEALKRFETSLTIAREVGDQRGEVSSLNFIGGIYCQRSELAKALTHYEVSLTIARTAGDEETEAWTLNLIGQIYIRQNELDKALEQIRTSLTIRREIGNRRGEAWALYSIAQIYSRRGEITQALKMYRDSLIIWREVGDRSAEALMIGKLADIHRQSGDLETALNLYHDSLTIQRELGNKNSEAKMHWNTGLTYEQLDQLTQAEESLAEALALFEKIGNPLAKEARQDLERVEGRLNNER